MRIAADLDRLLAAALRQPGAVRRDFGIKFQCPADAADGHDKHQDNACLFNDGTWGCAWAKDTELGRTHWEAIGRVLGALNGPRQTAGVPAAQSPQPSPPVASTLQTPREGMIGVGQAFATLYSEYLESPSSFFYFAFLTYFGSLIAKKVTLKISPVPSMWR